MEEKAGKCRGCGEIDVRRSRRKNLVDYPLSWVGFYPYRCFFCNIRGYKFGRDRYAVGSSRSTEQLVKAARAVSPMADS